MSDKSKLCMLIILDGWGITAEHKGNAVSLANTYHLDKLMDEYPSTTLICSGKKVGLPTGIMGNSEVGHLNIGAGRVVSQDIVRIDEAIRSEKFFQNKNINSIMSGVESNNSALHLMGLVSDGGVHSQLEHLFALLCLGAKKKLKRVFVHVILDGRDTPPDSGIGYVKKLQEYLIKNKCGQIATICGRFYAMDRDKRWERIQKAYNLYSRAAGVIEVDPVEAVKKAYLQNETDEFVRPVVITDSSNVPVGTVKDGDGIIFFNFRSDRAKQITRAFTDQEFDCFKRDPYPKLYDFLCMTLYDETFKLPVAFPPFHLNDILGEIISRNKLRQLRIAETEKYAHVTYFFNGGEEKPFPLEDRCLIPSPKDVRTYDKKPEMSAFELTKEVVSRINSDKYDIIVLNFANMDMVGHTGVLPAAVKACEAVDVCVGEIIKHIKAKGGIGMITADHGNAEMMIDRKGNPHTAHTLNPVPFILVDESRKSSTLEEGILGDIAPTILHIKGIDKPEQMTGKSLLVS